MRKSLLYSYAPSAYPTLESVCVDTNLGDDRALVAFERLRSARQNRENVASTLGQIFRGESCTGDADFNAELAKTLKELAATNSGRSAGSKTKNSDASTDGAGETKPQKKKKKKKKKKQAAAKKPTPAAKP